MGPHDPELVRRWQQGDPRAFEDLVRRWEQPVARLLSRLMGSTDLVEDLCQEVFLKVHGARARYRDNGNFAAWLYRIILNVARDAGRRQRRNPVAWQGPEPLDRRLPVDVRCQQAEAAEAIARTVAELPAPLREVLILHHYEGLNFEQIARLTGTPASTLKSRFTAALSRLRTRLHQLGWDPEEKTP
jgi:RNA polymerase sigma-70 factor (ECF subfamily)